MEALGGGGGLGKLLKYCRGQAKSYHTWWKRWDNGDRRDEYACKMRAQHKANYVRWKEYADALEELMRGANDGTA
jgi:hypothetical protein